MATTFLPDDSGSTQRPDMLTGLGILSFINCGLFLLIYGLGLLFTLGLRSVPEEEFMAQMNEQMAGMSDMMGEEGVAAFEELVPLFYHGGALLMGLLLLRTVARFIGAVNMWRGRRQGFYLYAVAQVVGIFVPHAVLPWKYLGIFGPFLALAFVALYGSQLKRFS
ncbi:MAG: hypothetical protein IPJ87_03325 [Flavobacteriales bacterium]|jgi:hypothetical protein|nr:hypothetical protein [Flavobacteriales bacterium]MBK7940897.1 hypothetical protein [Flavobacteriales bacterium]MBK8948453.1 hypothetical protein [Flavobacteriales bacterium]MBK9701680.1 hypothetical protein [Flavobacteriales bacterium]